MPMPDKMGLSFTPTEITDLTDHFNGILAIINAKKVVQLTPEERKAAQSASETRFPYIQNAIAGLAPAFIDLQPGFLLLTDATADLDASTELRALANLRNEVNDRMVDFAMASEHFAYLYMRKFYAIAQEAQVVNTPGADTVVKPLARYLKAWAAPAPIPMKPLNSFKAVTNQGARAAGRLG